MLEKQKKWYLEKAEKGIEWAKTHKKELSYVAAGSVGTLMLLGLEEKIFKPKRANITYTKILDGTNIVNAAIYTEDRFGIQRSLLNITYNVNKPKLKEVYRALGKAIND